MKKGKLAAAREAMEEQPDQEEMVCQKQAQVESDRRKAAGSEEVAALKLKQGYFEHIDFDPT